MNVQPLLRQAEFDFRTSLPGPTRQRTVSAYRFRLAYQNPRSGEPGCVLLWEVSGGRALYQIVLERQDNGELRWHCSCADAVYRGENQQHVCKHVRGLQDLGRLLPCVPSEPVANRVGA